VRLLTGLRKRDDSVLLSCAFYFDEIITRSLFLKELNYIIMDVEGYFPRSKNSASVFDEMRPRLDGQVQCPLAI
jgi:hypothetical protein